MQFITIIIQAVSKIPYLQRTWDFQGAVWSNRTTLCPIKRCRQTGYRTRFPFTMRTHIRISVCQCDGLKYALTQQSLSCVKLHTRNARSAHFSTQNKLVISQRNMAFQNTMQSTVPSGLVVRIPRSHRGGRGSIPRLGMCF